MCTLDIVKDLLKSNKRTQQELCAYIGVSKQAFTEWNGGRNTSYMKHLPKIAEFFDVSVDYLLGKEKKPSAESEELIRKLLENGSGKAHYIMFGGENAEVREIPPEAEAIIKSVLETFEKKNND